jgi:hypothetical protein
MLNVVKLSVIVLIVDNLNVTKLCIIMLIAVKLCHYSECC